MSEAPAVDPDDVLKPPTDPQVDEALAQFAAATRNHYGDRLHGVYLFGSRARGDHRVDSDVDVAVVLEDGDWIEWKERWNLNRIAYEHCLESGIVIQPWPFSTSRWQGQNLQSSTGLIGSARRDAVPIRSRQ
jgi:predicted nucleotidyltransferase